MPFREALGQLFPPIAIGTFTVHLFEVNNVFSVEFQLLPESADARIQAACHIQMEQSDSMLVDSILIRQRAVFIRQHATKETYI